MLIKSSDDKQPSIEKLQALQERSDVTTQQKKAIIKEINMMWAGIKGENEAAYELDFHFKHSQESIVLHDLRLEINGRVAQIDHLLINRTLDVFIFETKHFGAGIKINEHGEFLRWNSYQKTFEGMPSPIAQNQRHIEVLNDFFASCDEIPTRLGFKLKPSVISLVVISNNARIDRPKHFDTSSVIKCDAITDSMKKHISNMSAIAALSHASRIIGFEVLEKIGQALVSSHKPITIDYQAKFGLVEEGARAEKEVVTHQDVETISPSKNSTLIMNDGFCCSKCNSVNIRVEYVSSQYRYCFKCLECQENTTIELSCKTDDCKPRIRKQKNKFFKECKTCATSDLFYENAEATCQPLKAVQLPEEASIKSHNDFACAKCSSINVIIEYIPDKYGYYFKCQDCQSITTMELSCKTDACKPKIRKQKDQFFKECKTCTTSDLFYENKELV